MRMAWFDAASPVEAAGPRGGAPVGMLSELPLLERAAILVLRLWRDGTPGQAQIAHDLALAFGPARAGAQLDRIDALLGIVLAGARRPMMRHGAECQCFGGDESAFANMVAAAVIGERDDAMVFALALIAPNHAFAAVQAAEGFGLAVLGLARAVCEQAQPAPSDVTRH